MLAFLEYCGLFAKVILHDFHTMDNKEKDEITAELWSFLKRTLWYFILSDMVHCLIFFLSETIQNRKYLFQKNYTIFQCIVFLIFRSVNSDFYASTKYLNDVCVQFL